MDFHGGGPDACCRIQVETNRMTKARINQLEAELAVWASMPQAERRQSKIKPSCASIDAASQLNVDIGKMERLEAQKAVA